MVQFLLGLAAGLAIGWVIEWLFDWRELAAWRPSRTLSSATAAQAKRDPQPSSPSDKDE